MTLTTDHGTLTFTFPELGPDARLHVTFPRTLRAGDLADQAGLTADTTLRLAQGSPTGDADAVIPMWQSEATWIDFSSPHQHPFLVMIGVDGVNAISGKVFTGTPDFDTDDYIEVPTQQTLASYRTGTGTGILRVDYPESARRGSGVVRAVTWPSGDCRPRRRRGRRHGARRADCGSSHARRRLRDGMRRLRPHRRPQPRRPPSVAR